MFGFNDGVRGLLNLYIHACLQHLIDLRNRSNHNVRTSPDLVTSLIEQPRSSCGNLNSFNRFKCGVEAFSSCLHGGRLSADLMEVQPLTEHDYRVQARPCGDV